MYYVPVHIKTPKGMVEIGRYVLGAEKSFAMRTFMSLRGEDDKQDSLCIRLDLIYEPAETLPICMKSIGCNLQEYTQNCAVLTREIFRHFMFESSTSL